MSLAKPILAGGAAATVIAAAALLFPPFDQTRSTAQIEGKRFDEATVAFAAVLEDSQSAKDMIGRLGLVRKTVGGVDDAVLFAEPDGHCEGRGIYWVGSNAANPLAITAPHRGSDRHTGTLAATLFLETDARAAAWNSAPRRPSDDCAHAIDLAHTKNHLFSAFTLGFAKAFPDGLIVQLHGFEGARRENLAAQEAAMILSNGTDQPNERLFDLADELSIAFAPLNVLVFPIGTGELGATTNAQGQLLRDSGFDGFVHIEISAELRAALVEDLHLRRKFADALARAAR